MTNDKIMTTHPREYAAALLAATMVAHNDSRFIGLDKVRVPVAQCAALRAVVKAKGLDHQVPLTFGRRVETPAAIYDLLRDCRAAADKAIAELQANAAA